MGLAGIEVGKARVRIRVLAGAEDMTHGVLQDTLMKFQYVSRKGKGQVPKIVLEFDNSSGRVFNPLVLAVGLKLSVSFGYDGHMSKTFTAPVKCVRAHILPDSGRLPNSPRPDAYGTVVMEMHLHKNLAHVAPANDQFLATGPMRISEVMRNLAKFAGYSDSQITIQTGLGSGNSKGEDESKVDMAQIPEGETTLQYMRKLAIARGFYLSVTEDEFRFHRSDWKLAPVDVISYGMGPDLLNFVVEGDYSLNTGTVKGKALDPLKGINVGIVSTGTAGVGAYVAATNASADATMRKTSMPRKYKPIRGGSKSSDEPPDIINPKDIVTGVSSQLMEKALKRLYNAAGSRWRIKLTVVGNPLLFEGDGLLLDNFGPVVDGLWVISEVEHRIDNEGYTTTVTLMGKPKGKGKGGGPVDLNLVSTGMTGVGVIAHSDVVQNKKGKLRAIKTPKGRRKGSDRPSRAPGHISPRYPRSVGSSASRNDARAGGPSGHHRR